MKRRRLFDRDDDELDGCSEVGPLAIVRPTDDDRLDAVVLFADVDLANTAAVAWRRSEWLELFG